MSSDTIYRKRGATILKIEGEKITSLYLWRNNSIMIDCDALKVNTETEHATADDWQDALKKTKTFTDKFYQDNIIPSREETENN